MGSHPQEFSTATQLLSSPSHLLDCVLQLSVMSPAISAASSILKIVSMLLPSSLSALAYLILSPPRPPLLRMILPITPLETLLAPTLSMSSWASVSPGPWQLSTGRQRENSSLFPWEAWDS